MKEIRAKIENPLAETKTCYAHHLLSEFAQEAPDTPRSCALLASVTTRSIRRFQLAALYVSEPKRILTFVHAVHIWHHTMCLRFCQAHAFLTLPRFPNGVGD